MFTQRRFHKLGRLFLGSARFRFFLLILLAVLPGVLLVTYSIIAKQQVGVSAVILILLSSIFALWLDGHILILNNYRSVHELAKRLSSGDLTARSGPNDSAGIFWEVAQAFDHVAVSLGTLTERLQRQVDKNEKFSEIVNELTVQNDLATLLPLIADKVSILLDTSFATITLYDAARSELEIAAVNGMQVPERTRIRMGEGAVGRAAETRQPFLVERYDLWEGRLPEFERYGLRSVLQVPMLHRGRLIGVLSAAEISPMRKFDESDIHLMKLIAATAASAISNARLFEEKHRRLQNLEAINEVFRALRVGQSADEILQALLEKTMSVVNAMVGSIWLYEPADHNLYQVISNGIPPLTVRIKPGEQLFGEVFSSGQPYFTLDWREDPLIPGSIRALIPKGLSGAFIPIPAAQSTIGVLHVGFRSPHEFTEDQKRLLAAIAEIAGSAIQRAQLYDQTHTQLKRMSALHHINLAITGYPDTSNMLQILLDQLIAQLGVDAARVLAINPNRQTLEFAASRGFRTDSLQTTQLDFGESNVSQAVLDQGTIYIPDLKTRYVNFLRSDFIDAEGFVSYLAVPLVAKSRSMGVLEIFHRSPLKHDPDWMGFLEAMASQAAIMIGYARLLEDLQRSNTELNQAYDATLEGWSMALEARDQETSGHSQRVTEITLRLARAMGFKESDLVHIRRGALLHDIGKLAIPDSILLKAGSLNEEERVLIQEHPRKAFEMLAPIAYLHPALDIPYSHHEKWDGTGYPRGLKGEEIPLSARIFAIVDVWDALTSDRPYRKAWSREKAIAYIRDQAGKHFDPQVVDAFLTLVQSEKARGSVTATSFGDDSPRPLQYHQEPGKDDKIPTTDLRANGKSSVYE